MRSDTPHHIGCDLAVFASDEDPPTFAEAVYTPRPTDKAERAGHRLETTLAEFEANHKVAVAIMALLVFFALGLYVGSQA